MATLADLEPLIEQWAPEIRKAFLDAVYAIRNSVDLEALVRAIRDGDVDRAMAEVNLDPAVWRPVDAALSQAFEAGGTATVGSLRPARTDAGARLHVLFDARNITAESWLRTHSSNLIREIADDQRTAIRDHLTAGMAKGEGPRKVALDLVGRTNPTTKKREGGVIGLLASQEKWVRNYEEELVNLSQNALSRKLRDKRFDRTVAKAIKDGTPLSPDQVAKMVNAYRQRALKARAESIARTEAMSALNKSKTEGVDQAIAKGAVAPQYITKKWKSAMDTRVRETHVHLNGQVVPYTGKFRSTSGAELDFPGDPTAPASERVQCRCTWEIRIDYIAMAKGAK